MLRARERGACVLTRAGTVSITTRSSKPQTPFQAAGSECPEPSMFVLVPLSKTGTRSLPCRKQELGC